MSEAPGVSVSPELGEQDQLSLLRALLRAADYGILYSDLERRDIVCNRRFAELFGLDSVQMVRSTPDLTLAAALQRVREPERFAQTLDFVYSHPLLSQEDDIELQWPQPLVLRRYTAPVTDDSGAVIGRLWTFLDITRTRGLEKKVQAQSDRLKVQAADLARALRLTSGRLQQTETELALAEKKLLETEKLSAVGLLAASVAHDVNNILTPLIIEVTLADRDDAGDRREALRAMQEQLQRLSLLTSRLYAFARPATLQKMPVDVGVILHRVAALIEPQAILENIGLKRAWPAGLPAVSGDASQIEQLLVNLALNAMQAMQPQHHGTLILKASARGDRVALQVSDTGPGIAPEARARLFDPFFSTRPGGTGLGLHSCRQIVLDHGGKIRVRSSPGSGTCFSVSLPVGARHYDEIRQQGALEGGITGTRSRQPETKEPAAEEPVAG